MEWLTPENIAVLGTPVGFIAYLIYNNTKTEQKYTQLINKKEEQLEFWQKKSFEVSRSSQVEMFETIQATDKAMELAHKVISRLGAT